MKKFIISGTLCALAMAGGVAAPHVVAAESTNPAKSQSDSSAKIEQLMKLITELKGKLSAAQGQVQELMSNLSEGAQGDDVLKAQEILASDPAVFKVKPTGYFGPMTKEAIKKFQERYGLPVTGELDEATRAALQELRKERKDGMVPPGLIKSDEVKDKIKARLQEKWGDCVWGEKFTASDCVKGKDGHGDKKDKEGEDMDNASSTKEHKEGSNEEKKDKDKKHASSTDAVTRDEARKALSDGKKDLMVFKDTIKEMKKDDADKEDVDAAKDTLKEAEKKMAEARRAFAKRNFEKTVELSDKASSIVDQDGPDGIGVQVDE